MDNIGDEYHNYWETNMFYQADELDSWVDETTMSAGYYDDSSSPDGGANSSKNIVSERNRRRKLNERLFALRSVVPTISKMDKASIIKDAIDYIQQLQEEEKRIQKEILELEEESVVGRWEDQAKKVAAAAGSALDDEEEEVPLHRRLRSKKKKKKTDYYDSAPPPPSKSPHYSPIEVLELKVTYMGEKTLVVSLTCSNKRRDTMVKLCEVFESLNLKTIAANITALSGRHLLHTLFVKAEEEEKEQLKLQIETAIAALNNQPGSPMSM